MRYRTRYQNRTKQNAYMNACDCLYYGFSRKDWNACGLPEYETDIIWKQAYKDLIE